MGIAVATYGGAASATGEGGVINKNLDQIGNLIMLFVLFAVCGWFWPTYRKIQRYEAINHPNARPARNMFWGGVVAMPFWIARIGYGCVYAFNHSTSSLDPVMGSFAVKLVLLFGMWFCASVALCVGGWFGAPRAKADTVVEYLGNGRDEDTRGLTDVEMTVQGKR